MCLYIVKTLLLCFHCRLVFNFLLLTSCFQLAGFLLSVAYKIDNKITIALTKIKLQIEMLHL